MRTNQPNTNESVINWYDELLTEQVIWQYPGHGPHTSYTLNNNHSDFYINSDYLTCNPQLLKQITLSLFKKLSHTIEVQPDWVLTYPPFGVHIGFCLAELFKCKFGYIKSLDEPQIYSDLQPNETVLLCADDITSGTCMNKVIDAAANKKARILDSIAVVANLSSNSSFNAFNIVSLIERKIGVWKPDNCPLCAAGSPALPARENWLNFTGSAQTGITGK